MIAGFDWKPGDEAVMAEQDYGAMLDMFTLQARRYGMVNRVVSLPMDPALRRRDRAVVRIGHHAADAAADGSASMVNITGQILPVAKIADDGAPHGVQVMVDGAHAFGQLDFTIPSLGGDYYGASLHKWLGAPLGAGILYVRTRPDPALWPIYGDISMTDDDIRKLNHTGTHPVHTDLAINDAIDFHQGDRHPAEGGAAALPAALLDDQGARDAEHRAQYAEDPARSCAIANVGVKGIDAGGRSRRRCSTSTRSGRWRSTGRGAWRANHAAALHDDWGAGSAGSGAGGDREGG